MHVSPLHASPLSAQFRAAWLGAHWATAGATSAALRAGYAASLGDRPSPEVWAVPEQLVYSLPLILSNQADRLLLDGESQVAVRLLEVTTAAALGRSQSRQQLLDLIAQSAATLSPAAAAWSIDLASHLSTASPSPAPPVLPGALDYLKQAFLAVLTAPESYSLTVRLARLNASQKGTETATLAGYLSGLWNGFSSGIGTAGAPHWQPLCQQADQLFALWFRGQATQEI